MTISFAEALAMQSNLQADAYGKELAYLEGEELKDAARTHVLALLDEVHEVLAEVPWKPWKKQSVPDWTAYREEMVDAFHFFMNLMLIGGITTDELLEGYAVKHQVNVQRQVDGY